MKRILKNLGPILVFMAMILIIWLMNEDAEQRLNDCEKLGNQREVEYCQLSYLKGL